MRKPALISLTVAAVGALALSGCVAAAPDPGSNSGGETAASGDTILIGAVMAETGFMSPFDTPALNAMKIAVDELNDAGGIDGSPVELSVIDTGSDFEKYAPAAQSLIDDGAKVLMVTCDYDTAVPASQVAEQNNILNIAPCVGDTIYGPEGGLEIGFSLGNAVPGEASVMAEFAADQGWKSAVFVKDDSIKYTQNQCETAAKRFTELGGTEIATYTFKQGDSIKETVSKISGGEAPDVVFNCSYGEGGGKAAKELRDGGIDTPIVSGFGMDGTFWLGAIPGLTDYYIVTYPSVWGDDSDPKVNEASATYEEVYGARPENGSMTTGNAAIEAVQIAFDEAGSWDGDKLAAAFTGFTDVPLLVGPTSFSEELHVNVDRPQRVLQVADGALTHLETRAPEKVIR
ncbi:ABC transporter substrate-binding protein [Leucobacter luti]|uniref:Amino acid/amide ABC transporter substrate-binding protein (HAAT family) n=1 Tax=Leucobacter luti TaxID=340320 RepID=A0A4Q7TYC2_9MICO|nr:ABC transporter substrate-binding protein [Leucobacter luti]MBL3698778.1 amino acid ABC transporter substrate-binding protein [Leucobacter luti]RZT66155.1 amino acid/amide ABC transporter substrate-binding protein (HAAT family) [Leucobacter luti]